MFLVDQVNRVIRFSIKKPRRSNPFAADLVNNARIFIFQNKAEQDDAVLIL